jgi:hypothetical protein
MTKGVAVCDYADVAKKLLNGRQAPDQKDGRGISRSRNVDKAQADFFIQSH